MERVNFQVPLRFFTRVSSFLLVLHPSIPRLEAPIRISSRGLAEKHLEWVQCHRVPKLHLIVPWNPPARLFLLPAEGTQNSIMSSFLFFARQGIPDLMIRSPWAHEYQSPEFFPDSTPGLRYSRPWGPGWSKLAFQGICGEESEETVKLVQELLDLLQPQYLALENQELLRGPRDLEDEPPIPRLRLPPSVTVVGFRTFERLDLELGEIIEFRSLSSDLILDWEPEEERMGSFFSSDEIRTSLQRLWAYIPCEELLSTSARYPKISEFWVTHEEDLKKVVARCHQRLQESGFRIHIAGPRETLRDVASKILSYLPFRDLVNTSRALGWREEVLSFPETSAPIPISLVALFPLARVSGPIRVSSAEDLLETKSLMSRKRFLHIHIRPDRVEIRDLVKLLSNNQHECRMEISFHGWPEATVRYSPETRFFQVSLPPNFPGASALYSLQKES